MSPIIRFPGIDAIREFTDQAPPSISYAAGRVRL
jgi:hypothetical protein